MKNIFILCGALAFLVTAMIVGASSNGKPKSTSVPAASFPVIPSIGKIQVLNGCGTPGAANIVAEFLRNKKFDVKNIGNAPMSNYQTTLVASRIKDMGNANLVAEALSTDAVFLARSGDTLYDVTVFVGADYKERTR